MFAGSYNKRKIITLEELSQISGLNLAQIKNALNGKSKSQGGLNLPELKHIALLLNIPGIFDRMYGRIDLETIILTHITSDHEFFCKITYSEQLLDELLGELCINPHDKISIRYIMKHRITLQERDLIVAVIHQDIHKVRHLLDNGVNVHVVKDLAFKIAFENYLNYVSNISLPKLLIEYGADVNSRNNHALRTIVNEYQHHTDILRMKHIGDIPRTDHVFDIPRMEHIIKFLIENRADIHMDNDNLLLLAINLTLETEYNNFVKYLVEHGADVNAQNGACILKAIEIANTYPKIRNTYELIKYLLEQGAHINNLRNIKIFLTNKYVTHLLLQYDLHINTKLLQCALRKDNFAYIHATPDIKKESREILLLLLHNISYIDENIFDIAYNKEQRKLLQDELNKRVLAKSICKSGESN